MIENYHYEKLIWKNELDDCEMIRLAELDAEKYENRVVAIFSDHSYGYAYCNFEYNHTFLSDCPFPTVHEFYSSGTYDTDEADCYDITKEDFESAWENAVAYCKNHTILPKQLP